MSLIVPNRDGIRLTLPAILERELAAVRVGSLAVGAADDFIIIPPAGVIWVVQFVTMFTAGMAGSTGNCLLTVSIGAPRTVLIYQCEAHATAGMRLSRNFFSIPAGNIVHVFPNSHEAQILAAQNLPLGSRPYNNQMLIRFRNNSNVAWTNERSYAVNFHQVSSLVASS